MDYVTGLILGIVQGVTEFLPISSSGHLIIVRDFFGIHTAADLSIDAVLQLATVLAVGLYFAKDLFNVFLSFLRFIVRKPITMTERVMLGAIVFGTIPALVFGLFLETYMETVFRSTTLVAMTLLVGSGLMYMAERLARQDKPLTIRRGLGIGFFQALALVPGFSRSGATISGGLLFGLTREEATRFSFLLSFPIILGSGLKKLLELGLTNTLDGVIGPLALSFFIAFVVGLASIHFLIRYLKSHSLMIFVYYRITLALLILGTGFF